MAISFVGSAATAGKVANMPAGLVAGDVVILHIGGSSQFGQIPTPAGWTALREEQMIYGNFYGIICYRVWTGSGDPTTVTWTVTAYENGAASLAVGYRGVDPGQPVMQCRWTGTNSSTTTFTTPAWAARTTPTPSSTPLAGQIARGGTMVALLRDCGNTISPPAGWTNHAVTQPATTTFGVADKTVTAGALASETFGTTSAGSYTFGGVIILQPQGTYSTPIVADAVYGTNTGYAILTPDTAVGGQIMLMSFNDVGSGTITPAITPAGGVTTVKAYAGNSVVAYKVLTAQDCNTTNGGVTATENGATYTVSGIGAIIQGSGAPSAALPSADATSATSVVAPAATTTQTNSAAVYLIGDNGSAVARAVTPPGGVTKYADGGTAAGVATAGIGEDVSFLASPPVPPNSAVAAQTFTIASAASHLFATTFIMPPTARPPSAPTLTAPTNATYQDLASGYTFAWTFNGSGASDTQTSYSLRRKISGAGSYEYWNAGTSAFQSTEIFNASAAGSVSFAAGKWSNGNTYNWSVNTVASNGLTGTYAADNTVTGSAAPTITVTAPTGTQVTQQPVVSWTVVAQPGTGEVQTNLRFVVESGAYGVVPGSGTVQYDSGVITSAVTSGTIPVALPNNVTYRAFVQVTVTGGQTSGWGYSTFTVAVDGPAVPVLTASFDPALQRGVLAVQGRDNLLSLNQSSLETDTTGWVVGSNTTMTRSTVAFLDGVASLRLVSSAAGTVAATTPTGLNGQPVVGGSQYTALAWFLAGATPEACTVTIGWFDSSGTGISSSAGSPATSNTSTWTQATVTATAPANAAYARVLVSVVVAAASEVHYVDEIGLAPGASTAWTRGGLAGSAVAIIERSLDGGATWAAIRQSGSVLPSPSQAITVYDVEPPPNATVLYRTRTQVVV